MVTVQVLSPDYAPDNRKQASPITRYIPLLGSLLGAKGSSTVPKHQLLMCQYQPTYTNYTLDAQTEHFGDDTPLTRSIVRCLEDSGVHSYVNKDGTLCKPDFALRMHASQSSQVAYAGPFVFGGRPAYYNIRMVMQVSQSYDMQPADFTGTLYLSWDPMLEGKCVPPSAYYPEMTVLVGHIQISVPSFREDVLEYDPFFVPEIHRTTTINWDRIAHNLEKLVERFSKIM